MQLVMKVGPSRSKNRLESLYIDYLMAIKKTKTYSDLVPQIRVAPIPAPIPGPCRTPDGVFRLALDKQDLQSEADLCTLLIRRLVSVYSKITVDDAISCGGRLKPP